jgi:Invasion associated locus B (IalB) protein
LPGARRRGKGVRAPLGSAERLVYGGAMLSPRISAIAALALPLLLPQQSGALAAPAKAETATPLHKVQQKDSPSTITALSSSQNWSAYSDTEKGHKICYLVGTPSKSEPGDAKRGKVSATITHRPGEKVTDEVSFNSGYLFKEGSDAELSVDGHKFMLFTNKDGAWSRDAKTDRAVVTALAKGKMAVIKGVSVRGTQTIDSYSLAGLSQVLGQIDKACGVKR